MATIIYIADPMCSWCYGFGPEITALHQGLPEVPVELIMGGLRAHQKKPITAEQRNTIRSHWQQVHAASGLPFSDVVLSQENFVYDTEPACRAVVAARQLAPQTSLAVLHAIQQAFYAEGQDVTKGSVLAQVCAAAMTAVGHTIDADEFERAWTSDAALDATAADFALTKKWGVTGFPTVVLERDRALDLVASGFTRMPELVDKLQALVDQQAVG